MKHNTIKSVDMVAKSNRRNNVRDHIKEAIIYAIENEVNVELEHDKVYSIMYEELMSLAQFRDEWERDELPF